MRYHTGFAATSVLFKLMCESLGGLRRDIVKDNVYALVEESVGHYWDQVANGNIPGCLVAVTMVWTKVNHVDIGKWYQGIAEMNTPNSSGASRS